MSAGGYHGNEGRWRRADGAVNGPGNHRMCACNVCRAAAVASGAHFEPFGK